ncbi:hypothetical protein CDAR_206711 [Caerostris darwini]|uniref:Uncharacterized protein n=1 Tax=Caerostris darwini TaxID=1538125 RepID=A0AAV4S9E5_9ARAC|nr:hypothetical protein CDAR_206711 [Caerostris darwini]
MTATPESFKSARLATMTTTKDTDYKIALTMTTLNPDFRLFQKCWTPVYDYNSLPHTYPNLMCQSLRIKDDKMSCYKKLRLNLANALKNSSVSNTTKSEHSSFYSGYTTWNV